MKQQFVVTHIVPQKEIPALLENWVTNTPFVELFYLTYLLTYSMEQSPSCEANWFCS